MSSSRFAAVVLVLCNVSAFAGVSVSAPGNGSTIGTSVQFVASATSDAGLPISSMMIYIDNQSDYLVYSNSLQTTISVSPGTHIATVKSWDSAGNLYSTTVQFTATNQSGSAGVTVTSPLAGAIVGNPAHFVASATSPDQYPITSMMIYVDDQALYTTYASSLDTHLNLSPGNHIAVVKSWNAGGAIYTQTVPFTTGSSSAPSGNVISDIQQLPGWDSCSDCAGAGSGAPVAQYSMTQHFGSPSLDGNSTQFWLGGTTPYANALWWKNLPAGSDASHLTYDLYFYVDNPNAAEALEFDVNLSYNRRYYVFGTQCSPRWSHTWDTWDENNGTWNSTGVGCPTFQAYNWNHVTIELERTLDDQLHWVAITLNGSRHSIDRYVASKPTGYSNGISVDFQMDGDYNQESYSVWIDKMSLSYF